MIDWEYAGMNDPMWDLAALAIEADMSKEQEETLLKHYLKIEPGENERRGFWKNKVFVDYLWTLWGMTRIPFGGEAMVKYAEKRWQRMKMSFNYIKEEHL